MCAGKGNGAVRTGHGVDDADAVVAVPAFESAEARNALGSGGGIADAAVNTEDQTLKTIDAVGINSVSGNTGCRIRNNMGPVRCNAVGNQLFFHNGDGLFIFDAKHKITSFGCPPRCDMY